MSDAMVGLTECRPTATGPSVDPSQSYPSTFTR
jgi:hypothetical protein